MKQEADATHFILHSQVLRPLSSYSNSSSSPGQESQRLEQTLKATTKKTELGVCRLTKWTHLPCRRSPVTPSLGLSGRQLPGLRGTLLKRDFPRSRLPPELLLQLQAGIYGDRWDKRERTEKGLKCFFSYSPPQKVDTSTPRTTAQPECVTMRQSESSTEAHPFPTNSPSLHLTVSSGPCCCPVRRLPPLCRHLRQSLRPSSSSPAPLSVCELAPSARSP